MVGRELSKVKVSDRSQPPLMLDLSLSESAGSDSLHRLVGIRDFSNPDQTYLLLPQRPTALKSAVVTSVVGPRYHVSKVVKNVGRRTRGNCQSAVHRAVCNKEIAAVGIEPGNAARKSSCCKILGCGGKLPHRRIDPRPQSPNLATRYQQRRAVRRKWLLQSVFCVRSSLSVIPTSIGTSLTTWI